MSGFREGQAEPRNGTEELEHLYSLLIIVIILVYQLNKNDYQLTNKIYFQYLSHNVLPNFAIFRQRKTLVFLIGIYIYF
jgi:hypothetical protein